MVSPSQTHPRRVQSLRTLLLSGLLLVSAGLMVSQAAVTSAITGDGTLGTTVTPSGTIYTITGGTRPGNGPNLFHSFDRFSVGTNDTARFTGPTGIANLLSRVTGGQQSVIDGRLQSDHSGGQSVSAQSQWSHVWPKCQPGCEWVVSRQHRRLPPLCGWGEVSIQAWDRRAC